MNENNKNVHIPVLLNEVLKHLSPKPGGKYIDCTTGEGGHSLAIAKLAAPDGEVLSIERDPEELEIFKSRVEDHGFEEIITAVNGNFKDIKNIADQENFFDADGILFDLGFSSWQLEKSGRGFTFQKNEILDMRFDPTDDSRPKASDILNIASKKHLEWIFKEYGEEWNAGKIAKAVGERRKKEKFETTDDLANTVLSVMPRRGKIHPATKVFQALRIAVNEEFENIEQGIQGALDVVRPGGKIAVITFHSLEDRMVKNMFRGWAQEDMGKLVNKKVIVPSFEEVKQNPRARSAKLRVFEKHV